MGNYQKSKPVSAWQGNLGQMQDARTAVKVAGCTCPQPIDIKAMIARHGEAMSLWNRTAICSGCGVRGHYLARGGAVFLPLVSSERTTGLPPGSIPAFEDRAALWRGIGFTKRDAARIRALAEAQVEAVAPPPPGPWPISTCPAS